MTRQITPLLLGSLALIGMALPAPAARAATGNGKSVTGTAQATVLQPLSMTNTGPMRFGQIVQPSAAGTVTLSPSGTLTSAGGAAGNELIAQTTGGPQAGDFVITSTPGTLFTIYGPITFNLSNGAATMPVTLLTGALQQLSSSPTTVIYRLRVGGTLSLAANQAVGTYSGTYTLQTVYQ